jgi:hypothetical protein
MENPAKWTKREVKILREEYPKASWDRLLALLPGRTCTAITHHAGKLKIRRTKANRRWTEEETEDLKKLYPVTPWAELLAHYPTRTLSMIKSKAIRLGLHRPRLGKRPPTQPTQEPKTKWTKEEDKRLRDSYATMTIERLKAYFPRRTRNAIRARAHVLGLHKYPRKKDRLSVPEPPKEPEQDLQDIIERCQEIADMIDRRLS